MTFSGKQCLAYALIGASLIILGASGIIYAVAVIVLILGLSGLWVYVNATDKLLRERHTEIEKLKNELKNQG